MRLVSARYAIADTFPVGEGELIDHEGVRPSPLDQGNSIFRGRCRCEAGFEAGRKGKKGPEEASVPRIPSNGQQVPLAVNWMTEAS